MKHIKFKYRDTASGWKWVECECVMHSVVECINWYGLIDSNVDYEIISVEDVEDE